MVAVVKAAFEDILREMQSKPRPSHYRFELRIYPQDNPNKIAAIQIIHLDFRRNFETNYADLITAQAVFHQKDYVKTIYPNRNTLMAELKRIPIGEQSDEPDPQRETIVRNFRAVSLDHREDGLKGGANTDDELGMREVTFQLFDPLIEKLRLETFGTIFHKEPVENIIKWHLCYHSKRIKVSQEHAVKGVEMYEPNRTEVYESLVVPQGTPLLDLPGYIQTKQGGVYNHGIGFYLHSPWTPPKPPKGSNTPVGRLWYVYPLFNGSRYEKSEYRLDVVVVPPNQLQSIDRSWYLKDTTFYVATTGQLLHVDPKDHDFANQGNGVRFTKATEAFNGWAQVKDNKAVVDPSKTSAQYYTNKRDSGLQSAPFGERRFTDNVCHENTELTKRAVQYFKLTWNNSASEYLYPGMPARIVYHNRLGKQELYGTLLAVEENFSQDTPGVTSQRLRANCGLTFAVAPRDT